MKAAVVDASVVAAAFFQEEFASAAHDLLASNQVLHAPDLIPAEFANVIWKRHVRGEIDANEAAELLSDFLRLPLRITLSDELIEPALQLAIHLNRTAYDCLYLALAVQTKSIMISGDKRLVRAVRTGPLAKHIEWIGAL